MRAREERGGGAVVVDSPRTMLCWPRHQPSLSSARRVVALDDEVGDVEGLHLEPLRYAVQPGVSSRSPTRVPLTNAS